MNFKIDFVTSFNNIRVLKRLTTNYDQISIFLRYLRTLARLVSKNAELWHLHAFRLQNILGHASP